MSLGIFDIVNGISCITFVLISLLVGLKISEHYYHDKNINFILVGFTWIIMSMPWMAVSLSFILYLFTDTGLTTEIYLLIGYGFLPFGFVIWMSAIANFLLDKKKKLIILIFIVIESFFTIIFIFCLISSLSLLGTLIGPFHLRYGFVLLIFIRP